MSSAVSSAVVTTSAISNHEFFCNAAADVVRKVVYHEIKPYLMGELAKAQARQPCFDKDFIASKLDGLKDLDTRTQVVFERMIGAIDEQIEKAQPIPTIFKVATAATKDVEVQKKIVQGFALPYIKDMVLALDTKDKAIIDNVASTSLGDALASISKTISELTLSKIEETKDKVI